MISSWWLCLAIVVASGLAVGLLTRDTQKTSLAVLVTAVLVVMFRQKDLVFLNEEFGGKN